MGFKKVCVLLLAACVVITLVIIFAALYVNRGDFRSKRTYTFEDFYNETIRYKTHSIRWISDKEYLHKTSEGHVYLHDAETATKTVYLRNATFGQVDATDYLLSADKRFVVFESNYSKQWRHSFNASYHIYDLQAQEFLSTVQIPAKTQLFAWAPTGNKMAYVWNYNIYLKRNVTAEAIQATHDGKVNQILNGVPDWAYEEEILASNEALWWSPGGKFLAYLQINDTGVHQIEFSLYGNEQYPTTVFIPYSKAGCTIPRAKLFVIDTENPLAQSEFPAPKTIGAGDHYVSSVTWITDRRLAVQWMPRRQDQVLLQIYQHDGSGVWSETSSFEQKSRTGWVGRFFPLPPYFAADNSSFYKIMSDERGYKHLHYVTAGRATPITSGQWEVIYVSKVTKDAIYYVSNEHEGRAGQRNLYKVSVTAASHSAAECVTCSLRPERCQYNSAYFSMDASFFRMDCYGPGLPLFILMDNRGSAKELRVLEDNKKLEEILTTELLMPTIRRATLKIAGFNLWYQMMFPPNFDSSRKYPLLIQVYGGPASQNTDYVFRLEWATYLCSTEGVVIASFDGRGSGFQGDEIMHAIYGRLGTYEVEDQISAVRKFIEMGFIDESKIAIWGWSYGGYVTSMVLSSGSGLFSCGIAVAPVAKWEYYDAVYTERYMHKPEENAESYRNSSVTDRVRNMKSVRYMLVHGTADDNVHFQQAAQISKALVENQVDFEAMWYTDKDHGLSGKARVHLYTHLNRFLQTCFRK